MPPDVSKLLEAGVDLDAEVERATENLESIGLSSYEARGAIALVAPRHGNAETAAGTRTDPAAAAAQGLQ